MDFKIDNSAVEHNILGIRAELGCALWHTSAGGDYCRR